MIRPAAGAALLLAVVALQGCAEKPAPVAAAPQPRLFAADFQGAAKHCTVSKVALAPGKTADATMQVANDGGWCAISVALDDAPYAAGLLSTPPDHGKVYIHPVGNDTRIDYTPALGFRGSDGFTVTLLPGRPVLQVSVTVVP